MNDFSHIFTRTRKYTRYYQDRKLVKEVLRFFATHPRKSYVLRDIATKTGIDENVLSKWRSAYEIDNSFVPGGRKGQHRRNFTVVQEKAVADFLRIQYVKTGRIVRRKHLRNIMFELWKSFDPENRGLTSHNFFSYHFINNFCKRNGLSFRRMRKKKRTEIDSEDVDRYAKEYAEIFASFAWNRILNMDETAWQYVFCRGQTLAETGTEEVNAQLPDDYRLTFTVIATISAAGAKFPPVFLANGKTNVCHQQFRGMKSEDSEYELYHSSGGNTDDKVMSFYLEKVHKWMKNEPCALILDKYASHISEATMMKAEALNIRLVFIPTSATDIYQPLDVRIFGTLKSIASSEFDNHVFDHDRGFTKAEAADMFIKCWKKLTNKFIVSAWSINEASSDSEPSEHASDSDFVDYDSDYYSNDDNKEEEESRAIEDEELREIRKTKKMPVLSPPRPRRKERK